jgi:hypothetical protein
MALTTFADQWDMLPGTLPLPISGSGGSFGGGVPPSAAPPSYLGLTDLVTRVRMLLQDPDGTAWEASQIGRELHHSLLKCARSGEAQTLLWVQAVQHKTHYVLNEQALHQYSGRDTSFALGNLTTFTDSTGAHAVADIVAGDRLRNLTDGSQGIVTSGDATTLTLAGGLQGGASNSFTHGDRITVERPMHERLVVQVHTVLYNGSELWPMTQERLDRLAPGWERGISSPKYWSLDQQATPTVVQIHPAPLVTGSSVPNFPMNPLAQRWQENLVLVISEAPQDTNDPEEVLHWLDWYADLAVFETAARLAGFPGEWQALSVSQGAQAVADLLRQRGSA